MRHLFLDLEDTVITPANDGWHNTEPINIARVRRFIDSWKPDYVNIFSFAIWDDQQLRLFDFHVRPWLERELGIRFNHIPTREQIKMRCSVAMRMANDMVSEQDLMDFWGKQMSFRLYIPQWLRNGGDVALLDDVVHDEDWFTHSPAINAEVRNILTLC